MTFEPVTLNLPETIYQSAWRTAKAVRRPVEDILLTVIKSSLPPLEGLPPEMISELTELESSADAQLWRVARSALPESQQRKLSRLLRKNQAGTLTERERQTLDDLSSESERLMLRKARAYVLLKWRGYAPATALACVMCNKIKGTQTHARDLTTARRGRLFNPRKQVWRDHFEWSARSPAEKSLWDRLPSLSLRDSQAGCPTFRPSF